MTQWKAKLRDLERLLLWWLSMREYNRQIERAIRAPFPWEDPATQRPDGGTP